MSSLHTQPRAIIVGAGIIGLLTAVELLSRGYQVDILDQQQPGQAASWAGGGILTPLYPWKYDAAVTALARYGQAGYRLLNQRLFPYTSIDFEIESCGLLILDRDQQAAALEYAQARQDAEQRAALVTADALTQINPQLSSSIQQAVWFSQIAHVRNPRVLKSVLRYIAIHPSARLHAQVKIVQLKQKNQRVQAVVSHEGQQFQAEQFIFTTGAWTGLLSEAFNIRTAIKPMHGQMVVYQTPPRWLPTICMNDTMYAIPRRDGHIVCGSSTLDVGFHDAVFEQVRAQIIDAAQSMIPALAQFPIVAEWSGLRPYSCDGIPTIGQVPNLDNVWINAGHYRNGLVMAPASVQLLAQLMHGEAPWVDPSPYAVQG